MINLRFCSPLLFALILCAVAGNVRAAQQEDLVRQSMEAPLYDALRDGTAVAIMRHALAPGTGDPPEFRLEDCATQRNLSVRGRNQAAAIGERLRSHGISAARVFSSRWCRCLETARMLGLGAVEQMPTLDSFFEDRARSGEQTAALREFLSNLSPGEPVMLVTHQVNITALTSVFPQPGEIVVVRADATGKPEVLGTIPPPGRVSMTQ